MIHGTVTLPTALMVSISSMLVVFAVLLILYGVTLLFPLLDRDKAPKDALWKPAEEEDEALIAVLTAAIQAYEEQSGPNPQVRSMGRIKWVRAVMDPANPMVRDCRPGKD